MTINNFGPFDASIWGSVSDWAMIFITSLTAFLLFRTLKSQTKVTTIQSELLEIEQKRYLKQILPRLKFTLKPTLVDTYIAEIEVVDNPVNNLVIDYNLTKGVISLSDFLKPNEAYEFNTIFNVGIIVSIILKVTETNYELRNKIGIYFECHYENEIGVKYKIRAGTQGFSKFDVSHPEQMKANYLPEPLYPFGN